MIELRWVKRKNKECPEIFPDLDALVLQYRDRVYHHNPLGAGHVSGEKWQDVPVVEEE